MTCMDALQYIPSYISLTPPWYSNSRASVISLDLAMQSLYDGRYAVYMTDYSIGQMVNECQMTRSNTRPSQAQLSPAHVQPSPSPAKPGPALLGSSQFQPGSQA